MKKRSQAPSSCSGSEDFSATSHGLYQFSSSRASTYTERSNYTAGSVQSGQIKSSVKDKSFTRSLTVVFSSCFIPRNGKTKGHDDDYDVSITSSKFVSNYFLFMFLLLFELVHVLCGF
jgi:hypothetical protein